VLSIRVAVLSVSGGELAEVANTALQRGPSRHSRNGGAAGRSGRQVRSMACDEADLKEIVKDKLLPPSNSVRDSALIRRPWRTSSATWKAPCAPEVAHLALLWSRRHLDEQRCVAS
jgi:hypothetical protein